MNYYRITKYNPAFKDEKGHYMANDWTSVSDISKSFDGDVLTHHKYRQTEDAYVETVKMILQDNNISKMKICKLDKNDEMTEFIFSSEEKNFFNRVTDNYYAELDEVEISVRLALREVIWCSILSDICDVRVEFGYDYYMYIKCNEIDESTKQKIIKSGLFVELGKQEDGSYGFELM